MIIGTDSFFVLEIVLLNNVNDKLKLKPKNVVFRICTSEVFEFQISEIALYLLCRCEMHSSQKPNLMSEL